MINELDVWRDIDGYTINDIFRDVARVEINDPYNTREVLKKARQFYTLKNGKYTTDIRELGSSDLFEIVDRKTGKYVLQFELVEEG
jgi:hypothetical protein